MRERVQAFAMVPNGAVLDHKLQSAAFRFLCVIAVRRDSVTGWTAMSSKTAARCMGYAPGADRSWIGRLARVLRDAGYIDYIPGSGAARSRFRVIYDRPAPSAAEMAAEDEREMEDAEDSADLDVSHDPAERVSAQSSEGVSAGSSETSSIPLKIKTQSNPDSLSAPLRSAAPNRSLKDADLKQEFDLGFWPTYPRKVGKPDALKAYMRARRGGATCEAITVGLVKFDFSPDPTYRPHPATWLNKGRWADEPDPVIQPSAGNGQLAPENDYGTLAWAKTVPGAQPDPKDGTLCFGGRTGRGYDLAGFASDLCDAAVMDPTRIAGGLAIVAEWLRAYKDPYWIEDLIKRSRKPAGGVKSLEYFRQPVADAGAKLEADRQDQFAL
jgi:hypothetical protein